MWRSNTWNGIYGPNNGAYKCGACGGSKTQDWMICKECIDKFSITNPYILKLPDPYSAGVIKSVMSEEQVKVLYGNTLDKYNLPYGHKVSPKFAGTLAEEIKPKQDMPANVFLRVHYTAKEEEAVVQEDGKPKSALASILFS